MGRLARTLATLGLASAQLRRRPARSTLVVVGVALSVLSVTLLASIGVGVVGTGEEKLDASGRDLWITAGTAALGTGAPSLLGDAIVDAHVVAAEVEGHEAVRVATPIAFRGVYAGPNRSSLVPVTGVGIPRTPRQGGIPITRGTGFQRGDVHYANGTYEGPMTREVIVGRRVAARFDLSPGDHLYVGGSRASARDHRFTVVGVSPAFSRLLGTPTVTLHLSELQSLTGGARADRARYVTVRLAEGADVDAVQADLQERFPAYEVRTNREQLAALAGDQAAVFASGAVLVVLAVLAGVGLTYNLLALVVTQQRGHLAALHAVGVSRWTLASITGAQGLALGAAGGVVGLAATPPAVGLLNALAGRVTGVDSLLRTTPAVYLAGMAIAVGIGTVAAVGAGWRAAGVDPVAELRR